MEFHSNDYGMCFIICVFLPLLYFTELYVQNPVYRTVEGWGEITCFKTFVYAFPGDRNFWGPQKSQSWLPLELCECRHSVAPLQDIKESRSSSSIFCLLSHSESPSSLDDALQCISLNSFHDLHALSCPLV